MRGPPEPTRRTSPAVASIDDVPDEARALAPGAELGCYAIVALAGAGGMGEVYRARDRRLGRDVALKVLRPGLGDSGTGRERLLREAQAMARLSHPNVITVYEVGTALDLIYVSMEFVEGQTLRAWLGSAPRRPREVIDAFVRAGHGLAAVHRAGLVHRDFKPDNVLVGRDGRVRVTDFGLAGSGAGDDAGGAAGTPVYMAPEQHQALPVDGRADQFAFCVALCEALCGERPFAGASLAALRDNVLAGRMQSTPAQRRAPRWLRALLRRGLAVDRERRFPTMDALLARLERGLAWRRRAPVAAALVAAAGALIVLARGSVGSGPPPCAGAAAHLAGAWDPATRAAIERAFRGSGRPYAEDTLARVETHLDGYAAAWAAMRTEACEATAVRHEQSPALLDLRMQCLDRRLGELRALTALFAAGSDPALVDSGATAVSKLEPLDGCADADALRQAAPLPADPTARARIAAVHARVDEARALRLGGKYQAALLRARPALAEAEAIDYLPLEVTALVELSWIQASSRAIKDQEATLHRLIETASRAKDDARVARTWAALITLLGYYEDRPDEALALRPAAEAAMARAGDSDERRAFLEQAIGVVHLAKGNHHEAELALARAIALRERAPNPDLGDLAAAVTALGIAQKETGALDAALASFRRSAEIGERLLGPGHPSAAGRLLNIASVLAMQGKLDEARALNERVLAAFEAVYGPEGLDLALVLTNLSEVDLELGRYDVAAREAARAVAIKEKALGPTNRALGTSLAELGVAQARLGELDAAAATLGRDRAIVEKSPGPESAAYATALDGLALVAELRGRCRDAIDLDRSAIAIHEKRGGPDSADLAAPLARLGACQLALGAQREGATTLERALRLARGDHPGQMAAAEFALARAHRDLGLADARALAGRARAGFAALGPARGARVAEIDRWLAAHP